MPEYLSPAVYVEEINTGPRAIEGVSTSNVGFVGQTERGPTTPRLCTSWTDYLRWFGGYLDPSESYLPYAVKGFFDNGGQRAFIARVHGKKAVSASAELDGLRAESISGGEWGNAIYIRITDPGRDNAKRFRLTVLYFSNPSEEFVDPLDPANNADPNRREPDVVEDYDDLGFEPQGPSYVINTVNAASKLIKLSWKTGSEPARPNNVDFTALTQASKGDDIAVGDYIGDLKQPSDQRTGLAGLEVIDEISLLCVPDHVRSTLIATLTPEIVNQCERLKDRFAILQTQAGQGNVGTIKPTTDTSYAALYYPWIRVYDPRLKDNLLVPPGGHVAGIIARTDIERGVHKAPANAVVRGILNRDLNGNKKPLEYQISKGQHDILNPRGVNVIRDFRADGRGIRLWGARTLSSDPAWKYVNVRRLFLFVEESIDEGTQFVVFEPNHEPTWAAVTRTIAGFLRTVWRSGALQGVSEEEAFFVKCDRTTMTQDDIDNGRLICYIGIAPVKPAEFVIFRISQFTADAS